MMLIMKKVILLFILHVVFFTGFCQQKKAVAIVFEPVFGNDGLMMGNAFYKTNAYTINMNRSF